jgi:hypothetical protein
MNRTILDPSHSLDSLLAQLRFHEHAVVRLSSGLRLTWDQTGDGANDATFTATRLNDSPAAAEVDRLRQAGGALFDLSATPQPCEETLTRNDKAYTWRGWGWAMRLETIDLNA